MDFQLTRTRHCNKLSHVSELQMNSQRKPWQLQFSLTINYLKEVIVAISEREYRPPVKHCLQVCLPPSNERHCNWIQWILKHSHHSGDLPICLSRVPQDSDHTNLICSCHSMSLTHSALNTLEHKHFVVLA